MDESIKIRQATKLGYVICPKGGIFDAAFPNSKNRRGRVQGGGYISPTITTQVTLCVNEGIYKTQDNMIKHKIRKLTSREIFRLMDVDDEDIDKIQSAKISYTQLSKMGGNSIVVSCLFHIVKQLDLKKRLGMN